MKKITIAQVNVEVVEDKVLAPNSHNHGHVSTAFAWS